MQTTRVRAAKAPSPAEKGEGVFCVFNLFDFHSIAVAVNLSECIRGRIVYILNNLLQSLPRAIPISHPKVESGFGKQLRSNTPRHWM